MATPRARTATDSKCLQLRLGPDEPEKKFTSQDASPRLGSVRGPVGRCVGLSRVSRPWEMAQPCHPPDRPLFGRTPCSGSLSTLCGGSHIGHRGFARAGLGQNRAPRRQISSPRPFPSRGDQDFGAEPLLVNLAGERVAVKARRHFDVREHDVDINPGAQEGEGLVGVGRFGNTEVGFDRQVSRYQPHQRLVLDPQYGSEKQMRHRTNRTKEWRDETHRPRFGSFSEHRAPMQEPIDGGCAWLKPPHSRLKLIVNALLTKQPGRVPQMATWTKFVRGAFV